MNIIEQSLYNHIENILKEHDVNYKVLKVEYSETNYDYDYEFNYVANINVIYDIYVDDTRIEVSYDDKVDYFLYLLKEKGIIR